MFDTSHISITEYIDGDAFENLQIVGAAYAKTDRAKEILESREVKGVLVTHNSDLGINTELVSLAFEHNSDIITWFAQNAEVQHPKLVPIPIGLERTRWFPHLRKRYQQHKLAKQSLEQPSKLCLANFSMSTNRGQRQACLLAASSFATLQTSHIVCQDTYESYTRYLAQILEHKFVLCPDGNGVDTHRLWETLYLGRIPVVTRSCVTEAFSVLPMVILDSWNDLDRARLEAYWEEFREGRVPYTLNRLFMSFWKNRITSSVKGAST
jgi:hypothetical protein